MSRPSNASSRRSLRITVAFALLAGPAATLAEAQESADSKAPPHVDDYIRTMWPDPAPGWQERLAQDETQAVCSKYRNTPPDTLADALVAREAATIVLPKDGQVIGNWKDGEKIAQNGRGGQFSDAPDTVNGGNCYACHQIAPTELSFGTLGPSLAGYGKQHDFSDEAARQTFAKIYNPQATFACSSMPRFGSHGFLTEQQIKDVVAYLFSPESPVNK